MSATGENVRVEFLVEPFSEGRPGKHVIAAIKAAERHGLEVEVAAFANVATGPARSVSVAIADVVEAALSHGASRVSIQAVTDGAQPSLHVGSLQDALGRMIAQVETELGGKLADLDRDTKQAAVRMLDDRGAFLLRKAIEDVADAMGVSRITIYNYLNAIREE
jgi:uncharacterized protein YqgV (UPF0045/DUF77 family)